MAVGIRPNIALAKAAGIAVERGIVVDDTMLTSDPAHLRGRRMRAASRPCYGLVAPLWEQAKVCADQLAENGSASYAGSVTSTKLKVTGIDLFSAGDFAGGDDTRGDRAAATPRAASTSASSCRDNKIVGAVLYGDTADGAWYFDLMRDGTRYLADPRA